jgi:transcription termination factor Rho
MTKSSSHFQVSESRNPMHAKINPKQRGRARGGNRTKSRHAPAVSNSNDPQPAEAGTRESVPAAGKTAVQTASGVLELHPKGYGFLRDPSADYRPSPDDVFVSRTLVERWHLRPGNAIRGTIQQIRRGAGPQLMEIQDVDGIPAEDYPAVKQFAELTPINPESWLQLETGSEPLTTRVIDLLVPLGKGQRGLIVAPPRTGKTVLLQHIGQAVGRNHPDVKLMVLLIDERPEEVTEMRRRIPGQVLASSLDRDVESHVRLAQLTVERCKRLAERGQDVLLLIDSLTRVSRAFNKRVGNNGRTMSGGLDIRALDIPKQLFASARAFEEGGSLTIMATALVETGSRMDDMIFEEYKGTGNLELVLDRQLADRRIWPAIDITRSGTRREELLLDPRTLRTATALRRTLDSMHHIEAMEQLRTQLSKFDSNRQFMDKLGDQIANSAA